MAAVGWDVGDSEVAFGDGDRKRCGDFLSKTRLSYGKKNTKRSALILHYEQKN